MIFDDFDTFTSHAIAEWVSFPTDLYPIYHIIMEEVARIMHPEEFEKYKDSIDK